MLLDNQVKLTLSADVLFCASRIGLGFAICIRGMLSACMVLDRREPHV